MTEPLNPSAPSIPALPTPDDDRATRRANSPASAQAKQFAIEAARLIRDLRGEDIIVLDVRALSDITDYVLIASGTSDRQIKSVGQDVEKIAGEMDMDRFGRDADQDTTWIALDFVDVIVHLFEPATRAHYDLEMMWGDAPRVEWSR